MDGIIVSTIMREFLESQRLIKQAGLDSLRKKNYMSGVALETVLRAEIDEIERQLAIL